MKLIFLDIDGVLNTPKTAICHGDARPLKPETWKKLDSYGISMLKRLCHETGANVVLSSAWRMFVDFANFGRCLDIPIIGKTPALFNVFRGDEIKHFLDHQTEDIESYVIFDDDSDTLPSQLKHFIKVDGKNGISVDDYYKAIRILNNQFDIDVPQPPEPPPTRYVSDNKKEAYYK